MNAKISAFQFYSILFLTRLLTTLTYIPEYTRGIGRSDLIFQTLLRFVFGILIMCPVLWLHRKYGADDAFRGKLGKVKAVVFAIVFFYFCVTTVSRLDLFMGTVVFPQSSMGCLLVFAVALCAYAAYLGLEAIGRSAVLFLLPVIFSLVFIFAILVNKIDLLNLSPLFYGGVTPVIKTSVNAVGRTVEYAVIASVLPKVKGKAQKGFFVWAGVQAAVTALIFFFEVTVLGSFSQMQLFPVFTLASMAKTPFFHGLGVVITGVWVLCAFLKISLLLYLQAYVLGKAFNAPKVAVIAVSAALISVICLIVSQSAEAFNLLDTSYIKLILILLSVPVMSLVRGGVKRCVKQ